MRGPIPDIGACGGIPPAIGDVGITPIDDGIPPGIGGFAIAGLVDGGALPITIGRTGIRNTRVCDDGSSLARLSGRRAPPINRSLIYPCPIPSRLPTIPARLVGGVPYAYRW